MGEGAALAAVEPTVPPIRVARLLRLLHRLLRLRHRLLRLRVEPPSGTVTLPCRLWQVDSRAESGG